MSNSSSIYHGSCLCQAVKFSVTGVQSPVAYCHCSMCRKFHGASAGLCALAYDFHWLSGEDKVSEYTADNGTTRIFCSVCGSSLGFRGKNKPKTTIEVALGCLDEAIPVTIDAHIFTHDKASWDTIDDGLKQFEQQRTDKN